MAQARPIRLHLLVGVEEFLVAPRLHPKAHNVERGHHSPLFLDADWASRLLARLLTSYPITQRVPRHLQLPRSLRNPRTRDIRDVSRPRQRLLRFLDGNRRNVRALHAVTDEKFKQVNTVALCHLLTRASATR